MAQLSFEDACTCHSRRYRLTLVAAAASAGVATRDGENVVRISKSDGRRARRRQNWTSPPPGHMQPFGAWRPGIPVEIRNDVPRPREFFNRYCDVDAGAGRPLLMRGAARQMPAMRWSDADLLGRHGSAPISTVEVGLKETRSTEAAPGFETLAQFLEIYNSSDIQLVSELPESMGREVELLPLLRCGGFLNFLNSHKVWIARGGSRSVVHKDDAENINCLLAGTKRFALVHPRWSVELEAHPNSPNPPDRFGFIDVRGNSEAPVYGAFFGKLDVDAVDLVEFPGWSHVDWYRADMEAGDCLYIPQGWYHQVQAGPSRTVNAHVWYWRPQTFRAFACAAPNLPRRGIRFSDCSWGYFPPAGMSSYPRGVRYHRGRRVPVTHCSYRGRHFRRRAFRYEL